jgi:hypothetical protein
LQRKSNSNPSPEEPPDLARGVQPGRYLLLVFNKENLIVTKSIDFRGGKLTLDLDFSK